MNKISIIVPVFNVEPYLEKCLLSIVNQTYKNIEIILINDCSTDNSGQICKDFSQKYDNILYYQLDKNMGISYVRNLGINKAGGDLIGFVDGDDWIDERMYDTLYRTMTKYKCSIATCNYSCVSNNVEYIKNQLPIPCDCYYADTISALQFNINYNDVTVWNKLYKKSLFNNICFPVDKEYEDVFIMHFLIEKAGDLAVSCESLYKYNKRNDSITSKKATDSSLECLNAFISRHEYIKTNYSQLEKGSRKYIFTTLAGLGDRVVKNDVDKMVLDKFISERDSIFEKYELSDCGLENIEINMLMLLKSNIRSYKIARQMKNWPKHMEL